MSDLFRDRIEKVLNKRKIYPWGKGLGISAGATEKINKGVFPGAEILNAMMRKENLSISWLTGNKGRPYMIRRCLSDGELSAEILMHCQDEPDWNVHLFTGTNGELVVGLFMPAAYDYKGKPIQYIACELITGPLGEHTKRALMMISGALDGKKGRLYHRKQQPSDIRRLIDGLMGTEELFNNTVSPDPTEEDHPINSSDDMEALLEQLQQAQDAHKGTITNLVDISLMRAVITLVEEIAMEEDITLDSTKRAKVITAVYRHAARNFATAQTLDKNSIMGIIEVA